MHGFRVKRHIILSLTLYFGWLLSFPFYGPVLNAAAPIVDFQGVSLPFIFSLSHTLSFLLGGIFLRNGKHWQKLMLGGLLATLAVSAALPFFPPVWPWAMAVLGVCAAIYVLGWSYPYAMFVPVTGRLKLMASIIIGANIIYIAFNLLSRTFSPVLLLSLTAVPLLFALYNLYLFFMQKGEPALPLSPPGEGRSRIPVPLMLILCLFIAAIYLSSGFMYNIMQPFLSTVSPLFIYYRYIPYIAVLVVMWLLGERMRRYFSIYMGVSLLGLAFVSFALAYTNTAGLIMTTVLIEAAFAFLDLFIWTTLGDLAFIYGAPFPFFGFAIAAKLFSILAGELVGLQLLQYGEQHRLVTALFAAAAIFLTFSVIPWLNERMRKDFQRSPEHKEEGEKSAREGFMDKVLEFSIPGQKLTPREMEVVALLLKGMTNREIAAQLFISENTLKTHLRNIYPKFGITKKRELFSLVTGK